MNNSGCSFTLKAIATAPFVRYPRDNVLTLLENVSLSETQNILARYRSKSSEWLTSHRLDEIGSDEYGHMQYANQTVIYHFVHLQTFGQLRVRIFPTRRLFLSGPQDPTTIARRKQIVLIRLTFSDILERRRRKCR